jgi:hypothetical protein
MNQAKRLEQQKQMEKRKTLFGVRKHFSQPQLTNLEQSVRNVDAITSQYQRQRDEDTAQDFPSSSQ